MLIRYCIAAGMPENDEDWEKLAAAVYRAILQMLPASAMSWFGSLRDRSIAVATEVLPTPLQPQQTSMPLAVENFHILICGQCLPLRECLVHTHGQSHAH